MITVPVCRYAIQNARRCLGRGRLHSSSRQRKGLSVPDPFERIQETLLRSSVLAREILHIASTDNCPATLRYWRILRNLEALRQTQRIQKQFDFLHLFNAGYREQDLDGLLNQIADEQI